MKNLGERDDLLFCNDEHSAVVVVEKTSFEIFRVNILVNAVHALIFLRI